MKAALTQPRLISIALIGCLLALFPPPASSQGQVWISHGPEMMDDVMGGGPDFPLFLHSANLTPEQRAQVQKILDSNHPAFDQLFGQIHQERQQLDDQLFAPGPVDSATLERASQSISRLQAQLAKIELQTILQIRALMTPAQLNRVAEFHRKLESLQQQMHDLMEENRPPGPPGPHPPGPLLFPPMGPPPGK